jgi:hypothetical protein
MPQLRMLTDLELYFSLGAKFQAYNLFAAEPRQLPHIGAAVAETSFIDGQAISRSPGIISPRGLLLDTCTAFIPPRISNKAFEISGSTLCPGGQQKKSSSQLTNSKEEPQYRD